MRKLLLAGLVALILPVSSGAVAAPAQPLDPNWPCTSIKILHLSLAAVWDGPPLGKMRTDWQQYPAAASLAQKLAQRRVSLTDAKAELASFARSAGAERKTQLLAFIGALFAQLDDERVEVVRGLDRFGARQIGYAEQIRKEITALHDAQDQQPPDQKKIKALESQVYWDTRVFQSRKSMISYACFVPDLIEHRLFVLAGVTAQLLP